MNEPVSEGLDRDDRIAPLPILPHQRPSYVVSPALQAVEETAKTPAFQGSDHHLEPAKRYDAGKTPFADFDTFFDEGFAAEIGAAFRYGAIKYGKDNWKAGMSWFRCMNSCRRHLLAFWKGERLDPESGIHHLALATCSIMFLFVYERDSIGKDTR